MKQSTKKAYTHLVSLVLSLLLIANLIISATSCYAETPSEYVHKSFCEAADKLSQETVVNVEGNPVDTTAFLSLIRDESNYSPFKLYYIDLMYYYNSIIEYQSITSKAYDILHYMAENYYLDKITPGETLNSALISSYMAVIGDKYASYFTPEEFIEYNDDANATYCGIGVTVIYQNGGYLEIVKVHDGPALAAGILEGDIIVEVNGEDVSVLGYNPTIAKVRGEPGTEVTIGIMRNDELLHFTIVRQKLTEYSVSYKMMTGENATTGYIKISEFDEGTYSQFVEAYLNLRLQGADRYVFDVRSNPGGRLDAVYAILKYILPDGPMVHLQYKNDFEDLLDEEGHEIKAPIVVLTNDHTASAGELFSSAIRDYANKGLIEAVLVGNVTYGKGVGQSGLRIPDEHGTFDGSYITITTFSYDPPYGDNYDGVGITPDYLVELSEEALQVNLLKLPLEDDAQLLKALELLRGPEHTSVINGLITVIPFPAFFTMNQTN